VTNATLLKKFEELSARVATLEAENARVTQENLQLKNENQLLRQKLDQYIRHYFGGQRNEGLDKHQLELLLQGLPNIIALPTPEPKPAGEFLKNFRGKLQTDGYGVYESLAKSRNDLTLVGCWAHARRGLHEALAETKLAAWFVGQIGQLYAVEKKLREQKAGPQLRASMRVWQSRPVLARLHRAMELVRRRTLPQGLLGQAIDYALKRWEALTRFVKDGSLEIDNNLIENSIRPSAVGKRNWLFVGHPEPGERSAVIYTLLGSCRRHGVNPFDYLKDLFTRLPATKITEIKDFTPATWAKAKARENVAAEAA
jgi:transposase